MDGADADPFRLLGQLEDILDANPHIDEVGFVHPSQFALLNEEVHGSRSSSSGVALQLDDGISTKVPFWHSEHKLGISTLVLGPICNAAKHAFMDAHRRYRIWRDSNLHKDGSPDEIALECSAATLDIMESEVMKHSKALVLLSCDFGTAWNSRKLIVSRKMCLCMFMDELLLSALVLSYSPKSERAWSHRRWVIKRIAGKCPNLQEIVGRESDLVKSIAENSKMNYRAWNHRCWLISYMSNSHVLLEWHDSRNWAGLHVADNSCFHYRARLLLKMIENLKHNNDRDASSGAEFHKLWKEELDWVEMLIKRYVGREALWLHRRFLSLLWMKHLAVADQCHSSEIQDVSNFINEELKLVHSSTSIADDGFGDYTAQATHSATYILWLAKQTPTSFGVELHKSPLYGTIKSLLSSAGKSFCWDSMTELWKHTAIN